jgi:hypothetical protein
MTELSRCSFTPAPLLKGVAADDVEEEILNAVSPPPLQ